MFKDASESGAWQHEFWGLLTFCGIQWCFIFSIWNALVPMTVVFKKLKLTVVVLTIISVTVLLSSINLGKILDQNLLRSSTKTFFVCNSNQKIVNHYLPDFQIQKLPPPQTDPYILLSIKFLPFLEIYYPPENLYLVKQKLRSITASIFLPNLLDRQLSLWEILYPFKERSYK